MAKSNAVWGIDIGQCALKALRCRAHEKDDRIVVEAFDYIEYPKILTQPDANREELIREALELFVSRNDVAGERVAISVPGQSGLARFIKLPPVERKKIPDIVKYEARQQIPFALEDVVWDYQPLVGNEDEGYALETEVGIFAMKRDQVARALRPLDAAGIPVDLIQLAPLAIYNYVAFDRLKVEGAYDPANPPKSTVILSLGTDTTDLVITNGYRVWQRSIPIGGNHFTKALTKELKLTFAKAEHLKRNAMKAENPKLVFQAMRPVFSDLVAEIQRSIGFFTSNNRNAKLGEMIALGNPMKLPGLQRFLSQNLDQEVKLIESFNSLVGGSATAGPQFKENQLTFGVAYGLCAQALGMAQLKTNLLPEEIITTRLVRAKKPWAVAAVALLLLGMTINYASHYSMWKSADKEEPGMKSALSESANWITNAKKYSTDHTTLTGTFDTTVQLGHSLQSNVDGRLLWLEVLKAIDAALPKDERPLDERKETAEDVSKRPELHITSMDCEFFDDISLWYAGVQQNYEAGIKPVAPAADPNAPVDPNAPPADPNAPADPNDPNAATAANGATTTPPEAPAAPPAPAPATEVTADAAPTDGSAAGAAEPGVMQGPGYVFQLDGYHFHNTDANNEAEQFIINTFFKKLETGSVALPDGPNGELVEVPIKELGISHPVVITNFKIVPVPFMPQATLDQNGQPLNVMPSYSPDGPAGAVPGAAGALPQPPKPWDLRVYDFRIQFCWQPQPRGKRIERLAKKDGTGGATASADAPGAAETTGTDNSSGG